MSLLWHFFKRKGVLIISDLNERVSIDNLCDWSLYMKRLDGIGEIKIPANAKNFNLLSFNEIQMQIQNRNSLFLGTDEIGSHARIKINDVKVKNRLFGIDEDLKEAATILTLEEVKSLLELKSKSAFEKRLNKLVQTDAEKKMILSLSKKADIANAEAWKLAAIEDYIK